MAEQSLKYLCFFHSEKQKHLTQHTGQVGNRLPLREKQLRRYPMETKNQ